MNPTKVFSILDKSELAKDKAGDYHNELYLFIVHWNGTDIYMVEMQRKGDYKDALSDYNNSVFIKTLKELKTRVSA